MSRANRRRLEFATGFLFLSLLLLMGGCNLYAPYSAHYARLAPRRLVVLCPPGRQNLACVREILDFKRSQGFEPEILVIDKAQDLPDLPLRLKSISEANPGPIYALILATAEEIPMGYWMIEGLDEAICSDLPYFLGQVVSQDKAIPDELWQLAVDDDFPWLIGRIPFSDEETLEIVFRSTMHYCSRPRSSKPSALLGAGRFAFWGDSSFVMSRARNALRGRGWHTTFIGQDPPCEERFQREDIMVTNSFGKRFPVEISFPRRWQNESPDLVYLISHGSFWGMDPYIDVNQLAAFDQHFGETVRPEHPAILVTTGCGAGNPNSLILKELFRRGWICGFLGSTENNGPWPLAPAISAEINLARFLGNGSSVSAAVQGLKECFWDHSRWSPTYWFLPFARRIARTNILSYVYYGDPTLRLRT